MDDLLRTIEASNPEEAAAVLERVMGRGIHPWDVHLGLFPIAQRVLNPPFINPHLPKMHAICREFLPFLKKEDLPALVRLEVSEYARRPKLDLEPAPGPGPGSPPVPFAAVEAAVRTGDRQAAAVALAGFGLSQGRRELGRRMALLGSGYLDQTLGHSLSCSVFLLQEMIEREDADSWPAVAAMADYYSRGRFQETPALDTPRLPASEDAVCAQLLRAVSGSGVVDLHHTITVYASQRARPWCTDAEARHLYGTAIAFMEDKEPAPIPFSSHGAPPADYAAFQQLFARSDARSLVGNVRPMLDTQRGRRTLGRFLVKAVCDAYQGDYDPHFLTGLGSLLWVLGRFRERREVQSNALFQYASYLFHGLRRRNTPGADNPR